MGSIAVVYKSVYGSTKQYATWIAEALDADLLEAGQAKLDALLRYDTILYGGGLYAGGIAGIALITKNFDTLKVKRLAVFTVGLAATDDESVFMPILEKNLTQEMRSVIQVFHLRGAMDYRKLSLLHKPMMAMMKNMVARKKLEEMTDEDRQMLETYGNTVSFIDQKTIAPLLTWARLAQA